MHDTRPRYRDYGPTAKQKMVAQKSRIATSNSKASIKYGSRF